MLLPMCIAMKLSKRHFLGTVWRFTGRTWGNEQPTTAKLNLLCCWVRRGFWPAITTPLVSTRRGIKKDKKPRPDNRQYLFAVGRIVARFAIRLSAIDASGYSLIQSP